MSIAPCFYVSTGFSSDSDESNVADSGNSECDEDDFAGFVDSERPAPNHPVVIRRVRADVEKRLSQVAAGRCYVCDRIVNSNRIKRLVPPADDTDQSRGGMRRGGRGGRRGGVGRGRGRGGAAGPRKNELAAWSKVLALCKELIKEGDPHEVCSTCYTSMRRGKTPTIARANGYCYPEVPPDLPPLTEVAEHVLAPRLPFMQIMHLGRMGKRGQFGVKGSVINVPAEPDDTLRRLIPLLPEDDKLCVVNIKRKLTHKRPYASSFVNREVLSKWGRYLSQSPLYKKYGVEFDERLVDQLPDQPPALQEGEPVCNETDDPESAKEAFERLGQIHHSLLMEDRTQAAPLFLDDGEAAPEPADPDTQEVDVAPGEGRQPVSVVRDREAEELSFPSVFLGQPRPIKTFTRYNAMRSEVRRIDRRGARPIPLLYKYVVHCREQASSRLRHRFKRSAATANGAAITRAQLEDPCFTATYQKKGLAIPNLMPNSAQYWKTVGHDVFAMLRQLGRPTIFHTVSAAEYHWPILLEVLKQLQQSSGQLPQDDDESVKGMLEGVVAPAALKYWRIHVPSSRRSTRTPGRLLVSSAST